MREGPLDSHPAPSASSRAEHAHQYSVTEITKFFDRVVDVFERVEHVCRFGTRRGRAAQAYGNVRQRPVLYHAVRGDKLIHQRMPGFSAVRNGVVPAHQLNVCL